MSLTEDDDSKRFISVCSLSELIQSGRKLITVQERAIVLFYTNNKVYAVDNHCYHNGGPLNFGDIEDVAGHTCITCPWHKYKISLQTGEGFYQAIDPHKPSQTPTWQSKGVRQRLHQVLLQDDVISVKISDTTKQIASDYYYSHEYKKIMNMR